MSLANSLNKTDNENRYDDYVCVICSTQNQMVNYIPLKHFKFKEIYNLTIKKDEGYFKNKTWDKSLRKVVKNDKEIGEIIDLEIDNKSFFDFFKIKDYLKQQIENGKLKDKKIFWNVTGGQRNFVLAIKELARKDDVICYLEGNKNQMFLVKNREFEGGVKKYELNSLSIEIALKLMGFDKFKINPEENHLSKDLVLKFFEIYKKDNGVRDLLIRTKEKEINLEKAINELNNLSLNSEEKNVIKKIMEWGFNKNTSVPFGYILEELAYHLIPELENIKEKKSSVKLLDENNIFIDEFDIALLTKQGKFMIFECKSGYMSGDVAKSTKYSTYAISGVYGLPILITPLLENEIENLNNLDDDIYTHIKKAVKSAQRAGLEIWGLDKIEENLKNILK
ncbi:hypothetical protein [Caminibacter sp.]